jgi:FAD-linked sulfhydryl oxidase
MRRARAWVVAPGESKREWGRRGWRWLAVEAIWYPARPTLDEARTMFRRLWRFVSGLPCAECRGHATAYLAEHPPSLGSSEALQSWVWTFHNAVNRRLGKPHFSFARYRALYEDELRAAAFGRD